MGLGAPVAVEPLGPGHVVPIDFIKTALANIEDVFLGFACEDVDEQFFATGDQLPGLMEEPKGVVGIIQLFSHRALRHWG